MSISNLDMKILWGRAGGRCSKPDCDEDLTALIEIGNYTVGEMAHIIGSKPSAARGTPEGGSDTYDNLILLCPTHHTHIDKAPEGTYTVELLHEWKKKQEEVIKNAGKTVQFSSFDELRLSVDRLLTSNKMVFDSVGPSSSIANTNPNSNAYLIWELRRVDKILPNNRKILNLIDSNEHLIENVSIIKLVEEFRLHVESYEKHVFHRLDSYPLFPKKFEEVFLNE
ncbi:MAG: HNH endonuclease signature motif containing protein [Sulfurimonas sp.]|nr:HNH endonuclease signature motif containing protein [Sulfurimonas sp.]MDD3834876.1 HNH endonuclease signature motif containing protein [Sulfurimonas sp.]